MELDSKVFVSLWVTFINFLQSPVDKMGIKELQRWWAVRQKKVGWCVMSREDVTGGYVTPLSLWFVCLFWRCKGISAVRYRHQQWLQQGELWPVGWSISYFSGVVLLV